MNHGTVSKAEFITIAEDMKLHAYGIDDIAITSKEGTITLIKIWHVPNVGASLSSVIRMVDTVTILLLGSCATGNDSDFL